MPDVIAPDPDFTPNPNRAIYVQGVFDQDLIYRLTPKINCLLHESREPLTVYIDSPGGSVAYMHSLMRLLAQPDQAGSDPCRLITVATGLAGSAAADLLAAGDYALALPSSVILYHGLRAPSDRPMTVEETLSLTERLRASNDSFAMGLAREAEFRFIWRFISMKDQFGTVRETDPTASDLQCLVTLLREKLTEPAQAVLDNASERYSRYHELFTTVIKKAGKAALKSRAAMEANEIKAIVDYELRTNKTVKKNGFLPEGIQRLTDDFLLLQEYIRMFQSDRFRRLCGAWSNFLLTDQEKQEVAETLEAERADKIVEKVRPKLRPVWSFFVALCYVLQTGENQLTALDAFWLGLIDEVIGVPDTPSLRVFIERGRQDAEQKAEEQKGGESSAKTDVAAGT